MEKYQIIPRKFRPKLFKEVAGHEAIVTTLKNALLQKRIGQAYLFCGARGCGKTTLARLFAKALNCTALSPEGEPCNTCTSCLEMSEGRNLDLIEIDGASNRGIDDIREINETVGYAPHHGPYKIYLIDEVHMLTKEAFNALLKTLEEPPKTVKFFFATTEPHKIPPTILSRCQRFNLSRIPQKEVVDKLSEICGLLSIPVEKEALVQIAHLSEGSLRDAESLLDQLICFGKTPLTLALTRELFGLIASDHLFELDEAIQTQNLEKAVQIASALYESGKDVGPIVDGLLDHYRTYLLSHLGNPTPAAYQKNRYTKEECLLILDILLNWQQQMIKTPFKQIHLEMLLLTLVRSKNKINLETLVDRLYALEKTYSSPKSEVKKVEKIIEAPIQSPSPEIKNHPSKYDTLLRFAAVELEGTVQNNLRS